MDLREIILPIIKAYYLITNIMDNRENLLGVITTIFKWKKQILTVCLITAIGTVIISLLLPNYYKSSTLYYVASPDLALPEPVGNRLKEKSLYAQPGDIDRNLTIAESNGLVDYMVNKYNLYEHYEIDSTKEKAAFKVREEFRNLYTVTKTKFDAVELSIEDTDKDLAAIMINDARHYVERVAKQLLLEPIGQTMEGYKLSEKEADLNILGDSLRRIRERYGVYNALSQSEFLSSLLATSESQYARNKTKLDILRNESSIDPDTIVLINAFVKGLEQEVIKNKENLSRLNDGMASIEALERAYQEATEQLSLDKERYKQIKIAHEADPPVLYVIEEGKTPLDKSRPKRSIICVAAVLIAFIFSVLCILILEAYKDVNWKEIVNAK